MKTLLTVFVGLGLLLTTAGFATRSAGDDKTEVFFSNSLDFNDLVKLKLDLSQKQIILDYKYLAFDDNEKLKSIRFSVSSEGKYCGSGASENLTTKGYGFRIDRSPNAQFYFEVGLSR